MNGNFLVAWEEAADGVIGTTAGTDIIGVIFNAQGNIVRAPWRMNTPRNADNEGDFDIAATSDGGFILVFNDHDISTPNTTEIYWQRHNAAGNRTDHDTLAVETSDTSDLTNPQVIVNQSNDGFMVSHTDTVGSAGDLNTNATLTLLSNGSYASVYEENDGAETGIELQVGGYLCDGGGRSHGV